MPTPPPPVLSRKRGAPRKHNDGFSHALYVRVDDAILQKIETAWLQERLHNPGHVISRADVVRAMILAYRSPYDP